MITTILLAAGYATRLYPLTEDRPKALLPLGQGTILDAVIASLDRVPGLRQSLLVTNHRFVKHFRTWQRERRTTVQIFDDGTSSVDGRLGAIRDLELARAHTDPQDDVLVIGTDNVFHWLLADFVEEAQRHRPHASVALWQAPSNAAATQFGVVVRDASSRVTAFVEKSPTPPSAEVALCVYYFPASVCGLISEFIQGGGNTDAPGYFLEWLVRRDAVFGVMMPGAWYDIGTLEAYEQAINEWQHHARSAHHPPRGTGS